jgi:hypothetical protein
MQVTTLIMHLSPIFVVWGIIALAMVAETIKEEEGFQKLREEIKSEQKIGVKYGRLHTESSALIRGNSRDDNRGAWIPSNSFG